MFDMFAKLEAIIAKSHILAIYTLIHCLIGINFSKLASITVIVVLFTSNFFCYLLFFDFIFFLFDLSHNLGWLLISTKWTFYNSIIFNLMFGPLHKTLKMKGISANSRTRGRGIAFHDLSMADRT
jgi:hypothetical protein